MKDYIVYTKFGIQSISAHNYEIRDGALILLNHFTRTLQPVEVAIFAPGEWIRCDVKSEEPPFFPDQVAAKYLKGKG